MKKTRYLGALLALPLCLLLAVSSPADAQRSIARGAFSTGGGGIPALDVTSFDPTLDNAKLPVLVEFHAVWCTYCKLLEPHLDKLRDDKLGKINFYSVDADQSPELIMAYNVNIIPTLMIFYKGKLISRADGANTPEKVTEWVNGVQDDISKLPASFPEKTPG